MYGSLYIIFLVDDTVMLLYFKNWPCVSCQKIWACPQSLLKIWIMETYPMKLNFLQVYLFILLCLEPKANSRHIKCLMKYFRLLLRCFDIDAISLLISDKNMTGFEENNLDIWFKNTSGQCFRRWLCFWFLSSSFGVLLAFSLYLFHFI